MVLLSPYENVNARVRCLRKARRTYQVGPNGRNILHDSDAVIFEMLCRPNTAIISFNPALRLEAIRTSTHLTIKICGEPKGPALKITSFLAFTLLLLPLPSSRGPKATPVTTNSPSAVLSVSNLSTIVCVQTCRWSWRASATSFGRNAW